MAKKSKIARDAQRRVAVAHHAQRRGGLKRLSTAASATEEQRAGARAALQRLPRDASPTRLRNRDVVDGRPRAYYRTFGLSRVRLRQQALAGELPGVTKSSW